MNSRFHIENAVAAACLSFASGIPIENSLHSIKDLKPPEGRMQELISRKGTKIYIDFCHTPDALKNILKSLKIKPDTPNVLNYLAYGWVEREIQLDRSLKMLEDAYKANPESFYIIDSLAWAHFKKNNLTEAARLMEKVIDIAPGEAISLDHLGDIYYAMNRKREAIHFWQQALELAEPEDEITEDVQSKLDNINAG